MNYIIIGAAIVAIAVSVVISVVITRKRVNRSAESRIAEYQNEVITKHCEEVQSIYNMMRGWRHDYKNHIQVMRASLEMGNLTELSDYLGELSADLNTVDTLIKTGNVMADAILNSKLALCKARNIPCEVTATIPEECSVNDVELCVIIGNLLDNAIEACEKIEDKTQSFIRVYIGAFKNQFYISVSNSMIGTPVKKGKVYKSSKGEDHGFGLMRVDSIAGKYNGFVNRQFEEGVFATEIMLPFVQSK
ncbi:MAG: GHKL domain-containing protein [Clostridia bacterium]|nr:GHKL domain-containing protein [Clostridia bacterium]